MITRKFNPLCLQSFKNPHFSFTYSLLFSSQTLKTLPKSNAISDYFVQEHQFSYEVALKAASSLSHLKTPEKCDAVLSFFKAFGFSKLDLENIVESKSGPTVLCANVENTLKPKIKTFQDFGFSNHDIVCIVTDNPWLLLRSSSNRILPSLLVLENVLGSVDLVAKLLKVNTWFIQNDLEKTLIPNIEFLKSCGIHLEQLTHHIFRFPRFFLLRPENVQKFVEKVDEMGFNRESKMYLYAITRASSMGEVAWEKKLEVFRSLGFTQDQINKMFQKEPFLFLASQGKIKEVMQVISGSHMYDSSDIVLHPRVFNCSVEKRLKPRLTVLEILGNKNLIPSYPAFSAVHLITDKIFIKRFVTPFLGELGDIDLLCRQLLKKDYFVREHQFSSEAPMKAASSLSHLKTPDKCEAVLSFFEGIGFSKMNLHNIVNSKSGPTVLCANFDNILKPKIKTFQDFGFSNDDIVCILTSNSRLVENSANNRILPSLLVLKNVLGSIDLVAKLLKVSARFITNDLERTLIPNVEYLKSCGIHIEQLTHHVFNFPRLFLLRPESLKKLVEKVDEMRFNKESKMYIYAMKFVSSMSEVAWEKKLELFRSLGFTQDQIFLMFQKAPAAFAVSQGKIKEVMQVIRGSQMYDSSDIVLHPRVFTCSVERRLKPRLTVLKILGNRNLISSYPGFSAVYLVTDKEFIERFVTPFLDELSRQLRKKGDSGSHV